MTASRVPTMLTVIAGLATIFTLCDSVLAADQALIDAAKKEGELNWYTTQIITQLARPAADMFQNKYGIKVIQCAADRPNSQSSF